MLNAVILSIKDNAAELIDGKINNKKGYLICETSNK